MSNTNCATPAQPVQSITARRRAASERVSLLGAALRAMQAAPESARVTGQQLAAISTECEAASDAFDALFAHASFCTAPDRDGSHNCTAEGGVYIEGVSRLPGDPVPKVSAVGWANEEDGVLTVCLHLVPDEDTDDGSEGWFSAVGARQLAAQLIEAADLVDGGAA